MLGPITGAMKPGGPVPPVVRDVTTAGRVEGARTSTIKLSLGIELLNSVIKAFSGSNLDVSVGYQNAKTVQFQFSDVSIDKVEVIALDQYLKASDLNPNNGHINTLLIDDKIGVITAVMKAKKISVTAQGESGTDIKVDVPVIKGAVSGNAAIKVTSENDTKIGYEGATPIAFGVQAVRLTFDASGEYTAFTPLKPGEAAVRANTIDIDTVFINLTDGSEGDRIKQAGATTP
jgi:hypothetical protein